MYSNVISFSNIQLMHLDVGNSQVKILLRCMILYGLFYVHFIAPGKYSIYTRVIRSWMVYYLFVLFTKTIWKYYMYMY